ncbi:hypothetical protein [Thermosipho atlanticus]|uniref:Uncharacterized protein n=1 Tax=Thermosipho atlanticus DSM 15807 TaxID=1123380 RepID=A0A1M5SIE7_9BACT|nr:hypothetical protein [Thermosipho atlanticus]SHH38048.1 hypothetical protein SAMN02745199_0882 [Thermosipho atlanticus DSM 15807]
MYITKDTDFETIATNYPYLIAPLLEIGIKVIECGDVKWGTLGEEIKKLNLNLEEILEKLNKIVEEKGGPEKSFNLKL